MSIIIEGQARILRETMAAVWAPRDTGAPVGSLRFEEYLNGRSIESARVYSQLTKSKVSSVAWRAGARIARDHHISRHGNKR